MAGSARNASGELEAVHLGHHEVEQDGRERPPLGRRCPQCARGPRPRSRPGSAPSSSSPAVPRGSAGSWRCRRRRAPAMPASRPAPGRSELDDLVGRPQPHGEPEAGLRIRARSRPDPAAHQLDQVTGRWPGRAGAAVPPRRRPVGLLERLEDRCELLARECRCRCRSTANARTIDRRRAARTRHPARPSTTTSPRSVNLIALPTRLTRTCRSRLGSPIRTVGHVRARSRQASSSPLLWARTASVCSVSPSVSRSVERRPDRGRACRPRSWRNRGCR